MNIKAECPICKSAAVTSLLTRYQVPVHQHLIMKTKKSAKEINRGDLKLALCEECGFVFNQSFEQSKLGYSEDYDNSQTNSQFFEEYLTDLVRYLIVEKNIKKCNIVEIGCGKGWFLRKLVESEGSGNRGVGFDPSYEGPEIDLGGRLRFEKSYYETKHIEIPADVIICRHVIEHVQNPVILLQLIRKIAAHFPNVQIFFETPCVEWILSNRVIWDFFYEHCSYFTDRSLTTAFEIADFRVEKVEHIFGGQYLWLEASVSSEKPVVTKHSGPIPTLAKQFAELEDKLIHSLRRRLEKLTKKRKIALWGAGAKGVTLANLVDPDCELISCIVDLNPKKQGHYIPGSGHSIVSYKDLPKYGVTTAILMNPNYRDENLSLLRESNLDIDLIELSEQLEL